MVERLKNLVNGEWIEAGGSNEFTVEDPATKQVLAMTPSGTKDDADRAVQAAKNAFLSWKKTPAADRIQPFFRLKTIMESHHEELSRLITTEHGKTLAESRGSVRRAIQMVETACGMPSLMMGNHFEDIAKGIDCSAVRRPLGVFAGIAPFNFPAMVPFWFWPFAVASGNTYVLKASERVPLTAVRIFDHIKEAGFPDGVVNLVQGGKDVAQALCVHPDVKGISFVGSTPVARQVYQAATGAGKRAQALGGAKNFMVALPDAMQGSMGQKSIETAVESITGCAGERCLAGSVVISVGDDAYQAFKEGAVEAAKKIVVGNGLDTETCMGPLISQQALDRVSGLIQRAVEEGATLLLDGRKDCSSKGYFMKPTVLCDIEEHMEIAKEEVFGPVILLAKVKSLDDSIAWINRIPFANTTTLFTSSGGHARKFVTEVDPSMIGVNIGVPAPMSFFSFGGSKDSFFGDIKAHGKSSVEFFTEESTTIYRWYSDGRIW